MKVRFAPSPTGLLHVGNARVALINWLLAKKLGGRFLLRLDDTDFERSEERFETAIREDLTWMGLAWDEEARQRDRMDDYAKAAEALKATGRLYPCFETPEELGLKRKVALQAGRPPIYDRGALKLDAAARAKLEAEGRNPHWRFKLLEAAITWDDLVRGPQQFEGQNLSDPVLIREDGRPLYTLSSAVDDIDLGVTHIVRGEDHVSNTAVQIQLFEALGGPVPTFAHLPLMTGSGGEALSKRLGSLSLGNLRDEGLEPMALSSYLARLGTPDPMEARQDLVALVEGFDLSRYGRATPKFDPTELAHLNARVLHERDFSLVTARLANMDLAGFDDRLWQAVRGNLEKLEDARDWHAITIGAVQPVIEDAAFLEQAAALLPPEPWDETTWGAWTGAVKEATGQKGKALFHPLRLALTGREQGPELKVLLPLIGRAKAERRLKGETA